MSYECTELKQINQQMVCTTWAQKEYSGYKLTNAQMGEFILQIAILFATVAVFKFIKRAMSI